MSINLSDFLRERENKEFKKVLCFKGTNYSSLFFSLLLNCIKPCSNINFIDVNNFDLLSIILQLEQSFLGNNLFYWLGNISEYKYKKDLILYLDSYKGDHNISFFLSEESYEYCFNVMEITIDCFITYEMLNNLLVLCPREKQNIIKQFLNEVFKKCSRLSLDQFCMLINYAILIGNKYSNFIDNWLEKIIVNEHSFFILSKYFFAFDAKSFFHYKDLLSNDYSIIFWSVYWSDQLYRAFSFIYFRNMGKNIQAKQIAYRLPFSFIQSDWKKTILTELQQAYQFIYNLDYNFKNGASDFSLDLFYAKYFSREFRTNIV